MGKVYEAGYLVNCISGEKLVERSLRFPNSQAITNLNMSFGLKEEEEKRKDSFKKIFDKKLWGSFGNKSLAASGEGSTLDFSQETMAILHYLVIKIKENKPEGYRVKLLDAPCGDFVWMRRFLETRNDVEYTGVDIVEDLIQRHKTNNKNKQWTFIKMDLSIQKNLTSFDIILSRMMFQHLIFSDVLKIMKLFSQSESQYLVTTTFSQSSTNSELDTKISGRFRPLNLMEKPFCIQPPLCLSRDGGLSNPSSSFHFLGVWDLPLRFINGSQKMMTTLKNNKKIYSCYEI